MVKESIAQSNMHTKKRQVYKIKILKEKIIWNEVKPQEDLNEQAICNDQGMSKTPVMEALQKLAHDRLVAIIAKKGSGISNISVDRIREIFDIREMIECAQAIVDGDAFGAESAMREHLNRSLTNINQLILGNRMET